MFPFFLPKCEPACPLTAGTHIHGLTQTQTHWVGILAAKRERERGGGGGGAEMGMKLEVPSPSFPPFPPPPQEKKENLAARWWLPPLPFSLAGLGGGASIIGVGIAGGTRKRRRSDLGEDGTDFDKGFQGGKIKKRNSLAFPGDFESTVEYLENSTGLCQKNNK